MLVLAITATIHWLALVSQVSPNDPLSQQVLARVANPLLTSAQFLIPARRRDLRHSQNDGAPGKWRQLHGRHGHEGWRSDPCVAARQVHLRGRLMSTEVYLLSIPLARHRSIVPRPRRSITRPVSSCSSRATTANAWRDGYARRAPAGTRARCSASTPADTHQERRQWSSQPTGGIQSRWLQNVAGFFHGAYDAGGAVLNVLGGALTILTQFFRFFFDTGHFIADAVNWLTEHAVPAGAADLVPRHHRRAGAAVEFSADLRVPLPRDDAARAHDRRRRSRRTHHPGAC